MGHAPAHLSPYLTVAEAAPIIRRSVKTVYRYVAGGHLVGLKLDPAPDWRNGRRNTRPIMIPAAELATFLRRCGDVDASARLAGFLRDADAMAFIRVWGDPEALNRLRAFVERASAAELAGLCSDRLAAASLRVFLSLPSHSS